MIIIIFIIIAAATAAGIYVIAHRRTDVPPERPRHIRTEPPPTVCCGAHEVCEAETLLSTTTDIVYYSDEEIDRFRGQDPDAYSDDEIDELRDILLTLQDYEVAGWLRSLSLRGINLPPIVREEALMMVSEYRTKRQQNSTTHD